MSEPTRRDTFLLLLAAACATPDATRGRVLPPTAGDEATFLSKCIRCFRCGEVCTAGCIEFYGPFAGKRAGAPYIEPRSTSCNVCMECTQVCPSGALTAIEDDDHERIKVEVRMGLAYIDDDLCLSHQGRVCGVCHDACPYPGDAIRLFEAAKPEILDQCVGCGRCEERCPQVPAAIRVFTGVPGPRWSSS